MKWPLLQPEYGWPTNVKLNIFRAQRFSLKYWKPTSAIIDLFKECDWSKHPLTKVLLKNDNIINLENWQITTINGVCFCKYSWFWTKNKALRLTNGRILKGDIFETPLEICLCNTQQSFIDCNHGDLSDDLPKRKASQNLLNYAARFLKILTFLYQTQLKQNQDFITSWTCFLVSHKLEIEIKEKHA